jgi:hypothetical protein
MSQDYKAGDFLIFQLESGYGLLRILAIEEISGERIWHLAVYNELFPDVESADETISNHPEQLTFNLPHVALTNRAFHATQTAVMANLPISESELKPLKEWHLAPNKEIHDRSIRLMIGIR